MRPCTAITSCGLEMMKSGEPMTGRRRRGKNGEGRLAAAFGVGLQRHPAAGVRRSAPPTMALAKSHSRRMGCVIRRRSARVASAIVHEDRVTIAVARWPAATPSQLPADHDQVATPASGGAPTRRYTADGVDATLRGEIHHHHAR